MSDLFKRLPDSMNNWKQIAEGSCFFGLPISEMDREELLAIIGQLIQSKEQTFAEREREREFWYSLSQRVA